MAIHPPQPQFLGLLQHYPPPSTTEVKTEDSASPELLQPLLAAPSIPAFQFKFHPATAAAGPQPAHDPLSQSHPHLHGAQAHSHSPHGLATHSSSNSHSHSSPLSHTSTTPVSVSSASNSAPTPAPLYRFGPHSPFSAWPARSATPLSHPPLHLTGHNSAQHNQIKHNLQLSQHHLQGLVVGGQHNQHQHHQLFPDPGSAATGMSYSDDYDDGAPVSAHPSYGGPGGGSGGLGGGSASANDRIVRRRSSKACDQCRKSKCKCERAGPSEPCKNCIMLGTPCTFLGPSRKRGPPKGYIDAIEARLHQTEALLGILLATADGRARGLLRDIGEDPLAREIIARVDNSPYGVKGRKRDIPHDGAGGGVNGKLRSAQSSEASLALAGASGNNVDRERDKNKDMDMDDNDKADSPQAQRDTGSRLDLTSTHPSNEWQDRVATMLDTAAKRRARSKARTKGKGPTKEKSAATRTTQSDSDAGNDDEVKNVEEEDDGDDDEGDEDEDDDDDVDDQEESGKKSTMTTNNARRAALTLNPLNTNLGAPVPGSSSSPYAQTRTHTHSLAHGLATSSSASNLKHSAGSQPQGSAQGQGMYSPYSHSSDGAQSPGGQTRRTRRRLGDAPESSGAYGTQVYARSAPGSAVSLHGGPRTSASATRSPVALSMHWGGRGRRGSGWSTAAAGVDVDMGGPLERRSASVDGVYQDGQQAQNYYHDVSEESEDEEALVAGAVGQLSLNEDEEVRYHGKASGLYLLDGRGKERRNEGGIWRFPKARVWPALPSASSMSSIGGDSRVLEAELPSQNIQQHLLDLYFTYVQPVFPIVHKREFLARYRTTYGADSPSSPADPSGAPQNSADAAGASSPFGSRPARRRRAVPSLLLLAMFALASRYSDNSRAAPPQPSDPSTMWTAGDEYLDRAKTLLDSSYASSRPSTVQALLLMGYREIGIGAMAQAWTYIGMAIRMAQDLGMHRAADGWERVGLGGRLFDAEEISERRRIWFGCVIMDKYVSTYIGRPLMIFEWDFDTTLPDEEDPEEYDEWAVETARGDRSPAGIPGRSISCFNASAALSGILNHILQAIYAVKPMTSRHEQATALEGLLDKWYLDLPSHLRFDVGAAAAGKTPTPLPNVLTLHMQYWCAVLLLHRPFIRHVVQAKERSQQQQQGECAGTGGQGASTGVGEDPETRAIAVKRYELCNAAANHITSIVSLYQEKYLITRCSVFLCYYVFTAGIMHDTNLVVHPNDPQAKIGLAKCLNVLRAMRVVWPSAARAIELFGGASTMEAINNAANPLVGLTMTDRHKRAAENALDDSSFSSSAFDYMPSLRQPLHLQQHHQPQQQQQQHQQQQQRQQQQQQHSTYAHEPEQTSSVFAGDGLFLPPLPPMNTTPGSSVVTSGAYATPWQDPHHFNAPLSTAVLPQLYSTGLVDDGLHHASPSIVRGGVGISGAHSETAPTSSNSGPTGHGRRYPQYMDYAGYSQMVSPYDLPDSIQVSQQQQQQQQQAQQQIYLSEQYNLYNNQSYNGR